MAYNNARHGLQQSSSVLSVDTRVAHCTPSCTTNIAFATHPNDNERSTRSAMARVDGVAERRGPWVRLTSSVVHTNPWYSVRRDEVIRPDGSPGDYFTVESSPASFVVAFDDRGRIALVRLYRYTVDRWSLEVPAGSCESGETPLSAAQRELAEETGFAASRWAPLGVFFPANGLLREENHVFVARGLSHIGGDQQAAEGIDEVRFVTIDEAWALVTKGEISDAQTVTALALATQRHQD